MIKTPIFTALVASSTLCGGCNQTGVEPGVLRAPASTAYQEPRLVEANLVNGMIIRTGNVYGNVEARAYSYGPGFCTTHVSAAEKTVSILAPPAVYSNWVVVTSHSGSIGLSVTKEDQCDTGTEVQVRYWQ